jgi:putative lipoic acid-binding regulatory protein
MSDVFEFPCRVPVKVFGRNEAEFREAALAIMRSHFPSLSAEDVRERSSRADSYLSLTITVRAESRAQIDDAFAELTARPEILMVL